MMLMLENDYNNLCNQVLLVTQNLIKLYPRYSADNGILCAQKFLMNQLTAYSSKFIDSFKASHIDDHKHYVDVEKFDDIYKNYKDVEKYNLVAHEKSGLEGPTLILNGHIDVDIVDENKEWLKEKGWKNPYIKDGLLFGRGSCDMLSGLVSMALTSNLFIQKKLLKRGEIIFKSVCDEEIGGNGTLRTLLNLNTSLKSNDKILCIIAEPTENKKCLSSFGFMHFHIKFFGDSYHMGIFNQENSALLQFSNMYFNIQLTLEKIIKNISKNNSIENFRINIGKILAGIDSAIPINEIDVYGTIFYPETCSRDILFTAFKTMLENLYSCSVQYGEFGFDGAIFNTKNLPKFLQDEDFVLFPSPCDARLYKDYNIPTIIWGPGSLKQAHSINEYIEVDQIQTYIKEFWTFLTRYFA